MVFSFSKDISTEASEANVRVIMADDGTELITVIDRQTLSTEGEVDTDNHKRVDIEDNTVSVSGATDQVQAKSELLSIINNN